jgi:hypothetical protein
MADADHSVTFWQSVAHMYGHDDMVLFDLYNEPSVHSWECWLNGLQCTNVTYTVAGMQQMVNAIRASNATNVLMLSGLGQSNNLFGWSEHMPYDPLHNMAASFHVYPSGTGASGCKDSACYQAMLMPILQHTPVIAGEVGVNPFENYCGITGLQSTLNWLQQAGASYMVWTWDTWSTSCMSNALITKYDGSPKAPNGSFYKEFLSSHYH